MDPTKGPFERGVFVNVVDGSLARVLRAVVAASAYVVVEFASATACLVSDDLDRDGGLPRARTIEVVELRPRNASRALSSVRAGVSHGVIVADEPDAIAWALYSCAHDGVFVSSSAIAIAFRFPSLTTRQDKALEMIAQGESTRAIMRRLHISDASAKRDLRALKEQLGVSKRADLMAKAVSLGYPSRSADC
jgi:DNA-binding CsgD family transcriptional regulator